MKDKINRKLELLSCPFWDNGIISEYLGCSQAKASQIHQIAAKQYDGVVGGYAFKVKRDSVLKYLGINAKDEIANLKILFDEFN